MLGRDLTQDYFPYVEAYLETLFGGKWEITNWELPQGYTGLIANNGSVNAHVEMLYIPSEDRWYPADNVRFMFGGTVIDCIPSHLLL
jgi:hypothetical protein